MFKMSKVPGSIMTIMAYILGIIWDNRIESVSLYRVYRTLRESLRRSADGKVSPHQGTRDLAFRSAEEFLHFCVQRHCIYPGGTSLVKLIGHWKLLGHHGSDRDCGGLASIFYVID